MDIGIETQRQEIIQSLGRRVMQPSCGCVVEWEWQYASPSDVVPEAAVIRTALCTRHARDKVYQTTLNQKYRESIFGRLNAERETRRLIGRK